MCRLGHRALPAQGPAPARVAHLAGAEVARGLGATGLALAHAVRRAWAPPLLVLAWRRPRIAALIAAAFAVPVVQDALGAPDPDALAADASLRLLAELVALAGTWEGCVRGRTIRPLLPARHVPARIPG